MAEALTSLEEAIGGYKQEALAMEGQGLWIALSGLVILVIVKAIQSVVANSVLEARFMCERRSARRIR